MKTNFLMMIFVCIFLTLYFFRTTNIISQISNLNTKLPNHLWLYWENKKGQIKPTYIELCRDTVKKHCSKDFKIHFLNEKNVYRYFPNMRKDLEKLSIPQKVDYIRLLALQKYGGIWLDSDIIVFKSLKPLIEKLRYFDFAGFGCHDIKCQLTNNGFGKPANWVMISRRNGILITECLKSADNLLNSGINLSLPYNYHKLGRELLWKNIKKLLKKEWTYYHYNSTCIERDRNGNKYTNHRFLSNEDIDLQCNYYFMPMYNTAPGFPQWFVNMDKKELLKSQLFVSKLFNKALNKK
tara:strand:+ start:8061 stop:8945 length:885 start_codon:yes stop_codon:yes gene_type:complete